MMKIENYRVRVGMDRIVWLTGMLMTLSFHAGAQLSWGPHTEPVQFASYHQICYVDITNGIDLPSRGSQNQPWATPSYAISQISASASQSNRYALLLARGVYTYPQGFEVNSWIDVFGGFDPSNWERDILSNQTIIDLSNTNTSQVSAIVPRHDTQVDGLWVIRLTENMVGGYWHCGFVIYRTAGVTISNNVLSGHYNRDGGPIFLGGGAIKSFDTGSNPTISNNVIFNCNTSNAAGGGAILSSNPGATIKDNIICRNYFSSIYAVSASVQRNLIVGNNRGNDALGLHLEGSGGIASRNMILYNGGHSLYGGIDAGKVLLSNNLVLGNYSDLTHGGINAVNTTLMNNIVWDNKGTSVAQISVSGTASVSYCDVLLIFTGCLDTGFFCPRARVSMMLGCWSAGWTCTRRGAVPCLPFSSVRPSFRVRSSPSAAP